MVRDRMKWFGVAVSVAILLGFSTTVVYGQAPYQFPFDLNGSGSLLNSPPSFQGMITSGPMTGGFYVIEIDDALWPVDDPGTPENERWDYILANHFTYSTSGDPHWTGHFPLYSWQHPVVEWRLIDGADRIGGILYYMVVTILDSDRDGVVDQDELGTQAVAADFVCHKEQCAGAYDGQCGFGSGNGTLENYDPGEDDLLTVGGNLSLRGIGCGVPVQEKSWGAVKILYR